MATIYQNATSNVNYSNKISLGCTLWVMGYGLWEMEVAVIIELSKIISQKAYFYSFDRVLFRKNLDPQLAMLFPEASDFLHVTVDYVQASVSRSALASRRSRLRLD